MSADCRPVLLVTGAAGRVAGRLRPYLRGRFRLRLTDRTAKERIPDAAGGDAGAERESIVVGDLFDDGFLDDVMADVDAVLHLAGNASPIADWATARAANVDVTERLLRVASSRGVRRFVYGSSVHAAGQYVRSGEVPVDPGWPAYPCCYYGASKAAAEALCRLYATRYALPVASLRIGMPLPEPDPARPFSLEAWVSLSDLAGLVTAALGDGPVYGDYFAVSANTRSKWRIDNVEHELRFVPSDDAESYAHLMDAELPCPPCFRPA